MSEWLRDYFGTVEIKSSNAKSFVKWEAVKAWLLANPTKVAAIVTPEGTFVVTLDRRSTVDATVDAERFDQ